MGHIDSQGTAPLLGFKIPPCSVFKIDFQDYTSENSPLSVSETDQQDRTSENDPLSVCLKLIC